MRKFSKILENVGIWSGIKLLADAIGPKTGSIVGAGLTVGGIAQAIALRVAPQLAGIITAGGFFAGVVMHWLLGKDKTEMVAALANDGLTALGPAFVNGEYAPMEMQAFKEQSMEYDLN